MAVVVQEGGAVPKGRSGIVEDVGRWERLRGRPKKRFKRWLSKVLFLLWVLAVVLSPVRGAAQPGNEPAENQAPYQELASSLEQAYEAEQKELAALKDSLGELQRQEKALSTELSAYKIQLSAYGNLLAFPGASLEDLQKALAAQRSASEAIGSRVEELAGKRNAVQDALKRTAEQVNFNKEQLGQLRARDAGDSQVAALMERFQQFTKLIAAKQKILDEMDERYVKLLEQWTETKHEFAELSRKLELRLEERRKEDLFQRKVNALSVMSWERMIWEADRLAELAARLTTPSLWGERVRMFWRTGGFLLVTSVVLFAVIQVMLLKFQRFCAALTDRPFHRQHPWQGFALRLFTQSVPLLGATLFVYLYAQLQDVASAVTEIRLGITVLIIVLMARWCLDFLRLWNEDGRPPIPEQILRPLRRMIRIGRDFAVFHVLLAEALGAGSVLLVLSRVIFESAFLVWSLSFWRGFRRELASKDALRNPWVSRGLQWLSWWGYGVAGGGLLLELAGYGSLAVHWYVSWARTLVVGLWAAIAFLVLREWDDIVQRGSAFAPAASTESMYPIRWFSIRIGWLAWIGAVIVCFLVAWGARKAVVVGFFRFLNHPIPIGGLEFRPVGVVYAAVILFMTHAAVRLWSHLLRQKVLARSGLELGLRESITTISAYVVWALGILASLNALGFSSTSLAVAFGALGIGLGFGLQNIFNNFISGLILLFERPIQVGDALEINGTWGEVVKINVRSTVVQTWDNASLIIPNSEFVTTQVTNWSFKDTRLRRSIDVGVAYASDVERVRETLLEAARSHPLVLHYPEPSVLFLDFGDSALLFRLRVWTTVKDCLTVETDLRFEITRLFRERGIEIPFPQHDLHLRSVADGIGAFKEKA